MATSSEEPSKPSVLPTNLDFYSNLEFPVDHSGKKLLTEYGKIPVDEVDSHVEDIVRL
jgi:hypothetical protein